MHFVPLVSERRVHSDYASVDVNRMCFEFLSDPPAARRSTAKASQP